MPSIFSRIITGEIPCYKIYEDELTYAFLDIHPFHLGHTLIVPKTEVDHIADLGEPYYSALFLAAQRLAPALQKATASSRVGYLIAGFDVPHVHLHLIPADNMDDLSPDQAHTESPETMEQIRQRIVSYLD